MRGYNYEPQLALCSPLIIDSCKPQQPFLSYIALSFFFHPDILELLTQETSPSLNCYCHTLLQDQSILQPF